MRPYHYRMRSAVAYWLVHRYTFLFYTLLLTLIAAPVLAALGFKRNLLQVFVAVNLAAALMGIGNRQLSRLLLALLTISLAIRLAAGHLDAQEVMTATTVVFAMLGIIAATDAVRVAMGSRTVSAEHLYAALSAYLLAGIFFGVLHWAVGQGWPGAYSIPEGGELSLPTGIYFSFVTQATLGYGDVLPRSEVARGLAQLQAVAGQLYLAVMVARLVSLYVARPEKDI